MTSSIPRSMSWHGALQWDLGFAALCETSWPEGLWVLLLDACRSVLNSHVHASEKVSSSSLIAILANKRHLKQIRLHGKDMKA